MRKIILIIFVVFSLSAILASFWLFSKHPSSEQIAKAFPNNSAEIFNTGKSLMLFSLKPGEQLEGTENFHGFSVLGKTEIRDENFQKLVKRAFLESLSIGASERAKCFHPRHGLRISAGDNARLDLVICFECRNFVSYSGDIKSEGEISDAAELLYNQILKDAKIEISK
jgi:hypothetical protein